MVEERSAVEAEDTSADGDWNADPVPTAEEKPPSVLDSKEQIAALFCVEEFGVVPPPDTGWVPRDSRKEENTIDGTTPEWWRNTENREWIYHAAEDKYFHLPSNSLWERRTLDCADAAAEVYTTYYRVDAGALQALSHFAMSLDIGLMPLAFKAWVRYMRKMKGRHFGLAAPCSSPGKGKTSGRPKSRASVGSPKSGVSPKSPKSPKASPKASKSHPDGPVYTSAESIASADIPLRSVDPVSALQAKNAPPKDPPSFVRPEVGVEDVLGGPRQPPSVVEPDALKQSIKDSIVPALTAKSGSANVREAQPSEDQPLASKYDKGKGLFCLRCFRSNKAPPRPEEKSVAVVQPEPTEQSSVVTHVVSSKSEKPVQERSSHGEAISSPRHAVQTVAENVRPTIDTVERHMRKLESFLDLVKKNPQRLVDHVDRRRQDKVSLGFIVF